MCKRFFFSQENVIKGYNQGSSNIILEKNIKGNTFRNYTICVYLVTNECQKGEKQKKNEKKKVIFFMLPKHEK